MNGDEQGNRGVEGARVENRTVIVVGGPVEPGGAVVDKREWSFMDEEGLHEVSELRLSVLPGCGHAAHTAQDVGAACTGCGLLLCAQCSEERCDSCGRTVCRACARRVIFWNGDEELVYCPACSRNELLWVALGLAVVVGIVGLLTLLVIQAL